MPTITEADIRRHFDALQRGDADALAEILTDDFVQEWPQTGERVRGLEACLRIAQGYPGGVPRLDIRHVTGDGDHWAVEAVNTYPDGSVFHVVSLIELRDGRMVHQTDYFGPPYPAPEWRAQWVEQLEPSTA